MILLHHLTLCSCFLFTIVYYNNNDDKNATNDPPNWTIFFKISWIFFGIWNLVQSINRANFSCQFSWVWRVKKYQNQFLYILEKKPSLWFIKVSKYIVLVVGEKTSHFLFLKRTFMSKVEIEGREHFLLLHQSFYKHWCCSNSSITLLTRPNSDS